MRRATGLAVVLWALAALVLAIWGQAATDHTLDPPIRTSALAGLAVVSASSEAGLAAGIERGNRVLAVDGTPIQDWYRSRGWQQMQSDTPLLYRIEGRGGRIFEVELRPVARRSFYQQFLVPVFAAVSVVGLAFLLMGVLVWRLKPDRCRSWARLRCTCSPCFRRNRRGWRDSAVCASCPMPSPR
jgi:hypothetical protein